MKKNILFFALILLAGNLLGQNEGPWGQGSSILRDSVSALTGRFDHVKEYTGNHGIVMDNNLFSSYLIGGSTTTSDLYLKTTTGVGTTGADMHFLVGNNGGIEAMTILNNGKIGLNGNTAPLSCVDLAGGANTQMMVVSQNSGKERVGLYFHTNMAFCSQSIVDDGTPRQFNVGTVANSSLNLMTHDSARIVLGGTGTIQATLGKGNSFFEFNCPDGALSTMRPQISNEGDNLILNHGATLQLRYNNTYPWFYMSNTKFSLYGANVGINTMTPTQKLTVWGGDQNIVDPTDLGSESLHDGTFTDEPGHAQWGVSGGWDAAFTGNKAVYNISGGAGNLTQTALNMAYVVKPNRQYQFTYTVSSAASSPAATITTAVASSATALTLTNGAQTTNFKSAASPGTFTINATAGVFSLDGCSLKEVTGGDMLLSGKLTGGGSLGLGIDGSGLATFDAKVTFGNMAHVGLLHGAGASGLATAYSVGATAGNTKAMSYYVKSTSELATDVLEGLYVNTYHGTDAAKAAPSGEAGRFRAYLTGDAAGTVALTGMHSTLEAASGSSNSGLSLGGRSNIVYPDAAINLGTNAGFQAELYSGGASTSFGGGVPSILRLCIDGTITDATWGVVPVFDISIPANLVSTNSYIVDTDATNNSVAAKARIRINGVYYWLMLAATNN